MKPQIYAFPAWVASHLATSGISTASAEYAGIRWVQESHPGILFPFFRPDDTLILDYPRVRLFTAAGESWVPSTEQRYWQPKGSKLHAYFPRVKGLDWTAVLADPEQEIWITEGEKKALVLCLAGYPCLAISGVDCWEQYGSLLPDLEAIPWTARRVVLCFDADAADNPKVQHALENLSRALYKREARPVQLALHLLQESGGIDDYLVRHGVDDALLEAIKSARPAVHPSVLEIDEDTIYVQEAGTYYHPRTRISQTREGMICTTASLRQPPKRTALNAWLAWPGHRQVNKFGLFPGEPLELERGGLRYVNQWDRWGAEPVEGDVGPWLELLRNLTQGEQKHQKWLEQWIAYRFQTGQRPRNAVLLYGPPGSGKSLFCRVVAALHGSRLSRVMTPHGMEQDQGRCAWACGKTFAYLDDSAGNSKTRRHNVGSLLKTLITENEFYVDIKYQAGRTETNHVQLVACTNHLNEIQLDEQDRRWLVLETGEKLDPGVGNELTEGMEIRPALASAVMARLLKMPLRGFDPLRVPFTRAKADVIEGSSAPEETWLRALRDGEIEAEGLPGYTVILPMELYEAWTLYSKTHRSHGPTNQFKAFWHQARRVFPADAFVTFATRVLQDKMRKPRTYLVLEEGRRGDGTEKLVTLRKRQEDAHRDRVPIIGGDEG